MYFVKKKYEVLILKVNCVENVSLNIGFNRTLQWKEIEIYICILYINRQLVENVNEIVLKNCYKKIKGLMN